MTTATKPRRLCTACFEAETGHEPDMDDADWLAWARDVCANGHENQIVFWPTF